MVKTKEKEELDVVDELLAMQGRLRDRIESTPDVLIQAGLLNVERAISHLKSGLHARANLDG